MPLDTFGTAVLTRVIQYLPEPTTWLLDRYFPDTIISDVETIEFDVMNGKRRMSPFVSPLVEGKIVEPLGFFTNSLRPAYVKDKRVFDATRPFRRAAGEALLGGNLTGATRMERVLATEMLDQMNMLKRRQEWMAAQSLVGGGYTISGEKYQTVVINFGRASGQQIVLTSGNTWGSTGVSPLDLLQTWAMQMFKASGVMPTDVVMDINAWLIFRRDPTVQSRWNTLNQNRADISFAAQKAGGGVLMGVIDGFQIFVYQEYYVDDNDAEQSMLPTNTVLLLSQQLEGVRHYGAIKDHESLQAAMYFPKSWTVPDPSVRYLMLQSAPLVVPYRVNASFAATVA